MAVTAIAAKIQGTKSDPLRNFRYKVEIEGVKSKIGFSKVSGLNLGTSETISYREGDDPISPRKIPGQNSFDMVTFEKGLALDGILEELRKHVAAPGKSGPAIDPSAFNEGSDQYLVFNEFRREIKIHVIHRTGAIAKTFTLKRAWVKSLSYSDLDGGSSEVVISTMQVEVEEIDSDNGANASLLAQTLFT